ncbi:MAG: hypothetical protein A3J58_02165 [Candidatus Sungbacteria bacterium RIFCSPHIGHO2_02_FULL_52_23]|uniref:Uncharacterized protein n=1 Tax=Candidatus Sungbacteria bacterium RIFCSPHIGHO2_02_FULL_52_23 TaxID=1802274 RepID=A0A1G2KX41_9BACT|nr:MAG: hypothetical protein A3J58_02165 [Candidatus Sungbacteria bacterium RIFCSPHIGHO2_02_FULL_52_23]
MPNILIALSKHMDSHPKERKVTGCILIAMGVLALVTPFTPGAWLALIGLELLGVRTFAENYWGRSQKQ